MKYFWCYAMRVFQPKIFSIHRYDKGKRLWRVVHSMHASMEEVLQPSVANS